MSILWRLGCQREYAYWFLSFYSSIWWGFGACDFSTSLGLSPYPFLPKTYWIDMGPRGFPPNVSQELIFQTSAQSDKAIQSYPSANEGCRNGVLIVAKINVL